MDEEIVKKQVTKWIQENRESLPLNIDYWKIIVGSSISDKEDYKMIELGKYNTKDMKSVKFYKAISRII